MQEQSKVIRREGVILERFDKEKEDGHHTGFFVEWQGSEYFIRMHNGETKRIRKLVEHEGGIVKAAGKKEKAKGERGRK